MSHEASEGLHLDSSFESNYRSSMNSEDSPQKMKETNKEVPTYQRLQVNQSTTNDQNQS